MILARMREAWWRFFFAPQSPTPLALFRILYGACVTVTLILLHPEWLDWFGVHSWVTLQTMSRVEPGVRLNLFTMMPQNDTWVAAFFWIFLGFAILLTVGFWTRLSSIVVFVCLASVQQRNLYILHGGDVFLRVTGFFLMFAPAGAALSVDRVLRVRRKLEGAEIRPRAPWAQRMIQFELALMYFSSFLWKIKGGPWLDGTALFYVFHMHAIQRFPLPRWTQQLWILKLVTWYTLVLEFSLGILIWFRPFRYPLLLLGLLFHLSIEYSLNIPMFEWDVLTAYVLFIYPADLQRVGGVAREFLLRRHRRTVSA
ncbi:MAG TPA: HTTM domain-containing protein [Acidobacteriaceae bacterium]|nr:HTTM domain-containing protein [Acidobacteriaceae bacterium]